MKRATHAMLAAFGGAVHRLRTEKGIGKSAFVAATGIGWDRLAAIEDGELAPSHEELLALGDALGVVELAALVSFAVADKSAGAGVDKSAGAAVCAAFGRRLRELRVERAIAQDGLAVKSGIHRTAISKIERGATDPRLTTITRLAHGLDVPPGALIEGPAATGGEA
jgi:transcriptional regulator with XRE-family HTH domain